MAERRNMNSALLLFACFEALRFERALPGVKRLWNAAQPKYHWFYDVASVLGVLARQHPVTEEQAGLRCILLLCFLGAVLWLRLGCSQQKLGHFGAALVPQVEEKGGQYPG